ncbi:DMP19 family protein [Bacteroides heparinolyticus]|uniref:DMP19 family protein n=1 Tax=Prevotella heparinolytica TaxID=28113 RepID=UPI0035A090FF|nr:DMP19 family protein [Bacteroides heparinolyticus]
MIKVTDAALRQAAADGMDAFIHVFTEAYEQEMENNGNLAADTMSMLTAEQHSLLAYRIFRDEVMEGGFCQLIQNGYGGYIFDNPFAKVMRLWGIGDLSKLIYAAKKIYDAHRDDLERERTDEEFMAMYEEYEAFDDLEDEFLEKEEEYTAAVAGYVDEHIDLFATIV